MLKRGVFGIVGVGLAILAVALALLWVGQRRLIYLPFGRVPPVSSVLPEAEGITFATADGLRLGGWYLPARRGPATATILVFNGNGGNRSLRAPLAEGLSRSGYATLLFDYRGYGGNPGSPTEAGLIADGRAAREWLLGRGVEPDRLVYFGESLGTGVAVALAAEAPPAALILRSPFTSLVDIGRMHYPVLPVGLLLADRFESIARIARVDCPLLIVAGDRDSIVPMESSRRLFEAAPMDDKRLWTVAGADHNDVALLAGEALLQEVDTFVKRSLDEGNRNRDQDPEAP